jgi:hypothetical protein
MSISALRTAVTNAGGTPTKVTHVGLLTELITAMGGTPTQKSMDYLLQELAVFKGVSASALQQTQPAILRQIITALGGTPTSFICDDLWAQLATLTNSAPALTPVTFNPSAKSPYGALTNSNLTLTTASGARAECRATLAAQTNQSQLEFTITAFAGSGGAVYFGVDDGTYDVTADDSLVPGEEGEGLIFGFDGNGIAIYRNSSAVTFIDPPPSPVVGDICGLLFDKLAQTVTPYLIRSGSQVTTWGGARSWTGSGWFAFAAVQGVGTAITAKFGSGQARTLDSGSTTYGG